MKILIPVETNNKNTRINGQLGRAPYFLVKNIKEKEINFLKNDAANSSNGAGIKAGQTILNINPDILLTPRLGNKSAAILEKSNIKIYKTEGNDWKENIELFKENKLDQLF